MKKILVAAAIAVFGFTFAQNISYGAKAGVNLSNLNMEVDNKDLSTDNLTGFYVGGFANIKIADQFAFQPELLLSTEGASYEETETGYSLEEDYKFTMINVPLMLKWYPVAGNTFNVELGPQVGFVASAKYESVENDGGSITEMDGDLEDINNLNLSLNAGLAYELKNGLGFNARYNLGLTNISDVDMETAKMNVISFGVSYTFK